MPQSSKIFVGHVDRTYCLDENDNRKGYCGMFWLASKLN